MYGYTFNLDIFICDNRGIDFIFTLDAGKEAELAEFCSTLTKTMNRKYNDATHKDAYLLPRIDDFLEALQGAK